MKNILFFLTLISFPAFGQKIVSDSILVRNDSVFILKQQLQYDYLPDTLALKERYALIDEIIAAYEAEQAKITSQINFFKTVTGEMIQPEVLQKQTAPEKPKKKPARKPKTKKQ